MKRIAIVFCLTFYVGCSRELGTSSAGQHVETDAEDGGIVLNSDRDKAEKYLAALGKVQSAEEEEKLLIEFGEWLEKKGYTIRVEKANGKHKLMCPHFPPVTPWADHSFFDVKNLELLPQ